MPDKSEIWPAHHAAGHTLTRRELEVVHLVSKGLANKLVAKELGIREGTVKIHLHTIYRKLRVSSRVEMMLRAISNDKKWVKLKSASF